MEAITNVTNTLLDRTWEQNNRREDIIQRQLENERRRIDDARRSVDVKAQQLKSLSHQSALIAGFSMVVLVESNYTCTNKIVVILFGISASLVVGLMLTSMLNSTFLLVAISRYNTVDREIPFEDFWRTRCEEDWILALHCFMYGVPVFIIVLALVGWVNFADVLKFGWSYYAVSGAISFIAVVILVKYLMHTCFKWGDFLKDSDPVLLDPGVAKANSTSRSHLYTISDNEETKHS